MSVSKAFGAALLMGLRDALAPLIFVWDVTEIFSAHNLIANKSGGVVRLKNIEMMRNASPVFLFEFVVNF